MMHESIEQIQREFEQSNNNLQRSFAAELQQVLGQLQNPNPNHNPVHIQSSGVSRYHRSPSMAPYSSYSPVSLPFPPSTPLHSTPSSTHTPMVGSAPYMSAIMPQPTIIPPYITSSTCTNPTYTNPVTNPYSFPPNIYQATPQTYTTFNPQSQPTFTNHQYTNSPYTNPIYADTFHNTTTTQPPTMFQQHEHTYHSYYSEHPIEAQTPPYPIHQTLPPPSFQSPHIIAFDPIQVDCGRNWEARSVFDEMAEKVVENLWYQTPPPTEEEIRLPSIHFEEDEAIQILWFEPPSPPLQYPPPPPTSLISPPLTIKPNLDMADDSKVDKVEILADEETILPSPLVIGLASMENQEPNKKYILQGGQEETKHGIAESPSIAADVCSPNLSHFCASKILRETPSIVLFAPIPKLPLPIQHATTTIRTGKNSQHVVGHHHYCFVVKLPPPRPPSQPPEYPFNNFKAGQTVTARSETDGRNCIWELSLKPMVLAGSSEIRDMLATTGQCVTGYVCKVDSEWVWVTISRHVTAQIFLLDSACEPSELNEFHKRFIGALSDRSNENVTTHMFEGDMEGGRISKILSGVGGLLVQIGPHLYGKVHFTELTTSWVSDPLPGYHEGQFVKCKVLEISSSTKGTVQVDLSLCTILDDLNYQKSSGLSNNGGVQSRLDQVQMLLKGASEHGAKRIRLHILTDGCDVLDGSSVGYGKTLEKDLEELRAKFVDAQIASGGGRTYVTMGRYENDWSVVKRGWDAQVLGDAPYKFRSALEAVKKLREDKKVNDQYLSPFVIVDENREGGTHW